MEALSLLIEGDRAGAQKALEGAGADEPYSPLRELLWAISRGDEVRDRDIMAASRVVPESAVRFTVGSLLELHGRRQDAMPHLRRAAELRPGSTGLSAKVGAWLYKTGSFEEAIPFLEEAAREEPDDQGGAAMLLMAYVRSRGLAKAIPMLEERVRENPRSAEDRFLLSWAYLLMGQKKKGLLPKALQHKEAAESLGWHATADYLHLLAVTYLKAGEGGKALCEYADAIERGAVVSWKKEVGPAMLLVCTGLRKRTPQPARLVNALRRLAAAYPGEMLAHLTLSMAYVAEGKADNALEEALIAGMLAPEEASRLAPYIASLRRAAAAPEARAERAKRRFQQIKGSANKSRVPPDKKEADISGESPGERAIPEDATSPEPVPP
jgi:tetratricopeptide (TPR) repeat protein